MKVLKAASIGAGQSVITKLLLDHQWLGPGKPKDCLCNWRSPMGTKNNLEAHATHVAEAILEEV
jgi:hypothetical protein